MASDLLLWPITLPKGLVTAVGFPAEVTRVVTKSSHFPLVKFPFLLCMKGLGGLTGTLLLVVNIIRPLLIIVVIIVKQRNVYL